MELLEGTEEVNCA